MIWIRFNFVQHLNRFIFLVIHEVCKGNIVFGLFLIGTIGQILNSAQIQKTERLQGNEIAAFLPWLPGNLDLLEGLISAAWTAITSSQF